jgi:hypothetical protein
VTAPIGVGLRPGACSPRQPGGVCWTKQHSNLT